MAILVASTNIGDEEGVNIGTILWVTSFSLATGDLELWYGTHYTAFCLCIYIYVQV